MSRPTTPQDTPQRILDIATELVQSRGFNGFSYADIAARLQVTKASLHYHFPSKADLGRSLIERYESRVVDALAAIDLEAGDELQSLRGYVRIYAAVLQDRRLCLCGMLAAEYGTLPEPMRQGLQHYFDANERWLARVLERGRARGTLEFDGAPSEVAAMLVGALEGAMMLARSFDDPRRFARAAERLLAEIDAAPVPGRPARRREVVAGRPAG